MCIRDSLFMDASENGVPGVWDLMESGQAQDVKHVSQLVKLLRGSQTMANFYTERAAKFGTGAPDEEDISNGADTTEEDGEPDENGEGEWCSNCNEYHYENY